MISTYGDAAIWLANALLAGVILGLLARLTKVGGR